MSIDWDKRQGTLGKHRHLPSDVLDVDTGGAVVQAVLSRTTVLTDAQIKALPTTSIELVPAPGVGRLLQLVLAVVALDTSAGAYVCLDPGETYIAHSDGGRRSVAYEEADQGALASAGLTHIWFPNSANLGPSGDPTANSGTMSSNDPLFFQNVNGTDYTGGHASNTLTVSVWYGIVDLP